MTHRKKHTVVDNQDPLQMGRLKVRIDGQPEKPVADLPWVYPHRLVGYGFTRIPNIGERF